MKTRTGFVSNSSSSSFVLEVGKPFDTVLEVAEHMVPQREWEDDAALVAAIQKLRRSGEKYYAVCFPSCNYDTFIAKMGNLFLVETCHNHDWDLRDVSVSAIVPHEFLEYFGDDSFYDLPKRLPFYHLKYGVTVRQPDWRETGYNWCPKCHGDFWVIGDTIKCLNCGMNYKDLPNKKS
jgi:hypothetical protein